MLFNLAFILLPRANYVGLKRQFPLLPFKGLDSRIYSEHKRKLGKSSFDRVGCFKICFSGAFEIDYLCSSPREYTKAVLMEKNHHMINFNFYSLSRDPI